MSDNEFIHGPNPLCRFLGDPLCDNIYHVTSRIVGDAHLLKKASLKEKLVSLIQDCADICAVSVLTYCVLDNHFHILVEIPSRVKTDTKFRGVENEAKLWRHLRQACNLEVVNRLDQRVTALREAGYLREAHELLDDIVSRMGDLSWYVKEVKERFSKWYNKCHDRRGTLWMERFRSVLIEHGEAAEILASYIDLNPVRAEIVQDSKNYRWCGYGAAVSGESTARAGLCKLFGRTLRSWDKQQIQKRYRALLVDALEAPRFKQSRGKSLPQDLSQGQLLRCQVRYFTCGIAIGTSSYLEEVFALRRHFFGEKRKSGAREMEGGDWNTLRSMRSLPTNPFRPMSYF